MLVNIQHVKECRNKAYGNFLLRGHSNALITISLKKNKDRAEYAATLLHELLHLYITMLRQQGFRTTDKKEHKCIEIIEQVIIHSMQKAL